MARGVITISIQALAAALLLPEDYKLTHVYRSSDRLVCLLVEHDSIPESWPLAEVTPFYSLEENEDRTSRVVKIARIEVVNE